MRTVLTEQEHHELGRVGDEFDIELAKITARALVQLPEAIEEVALYYLQDRTSLFSPLTFDETQKELKKLRETRDKEAQSR